MKITGSGLAAVLAVAYFAGGGIASVTAAAIAAGRGDVGFAVNAAALGVLLLAAGAVLAVLLSRPDPG